MKIVYTNYGALVGTEHDGFSTFLGVPYAQPPVGDLRWKAPQPLQSWEGEREATVFAHRAWQTVQQEPKDGQGINYAKEFYADPDYLPPMDEDCLYLNIWTPAASAEEKLPIALWIHGGAFLNGYGSEIEFDGEAFAKRGVILVTINYRLGVFGFLSHPELRAEDPDGHCGNYGILDQIAALRWVYENISAFGGDPERITIFGQSAGAMSVQTLLSSPLTKGMIAGAILQSGGGYRGGFSSNRTMEQAEALGNEYLRICGANSIAEMRRLPPQKLMDKLPELMGVSFGMGLGLPCSPVLDGYLLTEEYDTVIEKGHHPDIPYMLGSCRDDMMVTPGTDGHDSPIYLGCVNWSLQTQSLGRPAAYVYQFARRLPGDDAGAFHSAELWYVFHTLSRCWRPMSEADEELSMRMCDYWCNFVKTGDPNGIGLPQWKPCASDLPYVHILDVVD